MQGIFICMCECVIVYVCVSTNVCGCLDVTVLIDACIGGLVHLCV